MDTLHLLGELRVSLRVSQYLIPNSQYYGRNDTEGVEPHHFLDKRQANVAPCDYHSIIFSSPDKLEPERAEPN